jgi:5,10-methenyltetrahydrofolate synthetase
MPGQSGVLEVHVWSGDEADLEAHHLPTLREIKAGTPLVDLDPWRIPGAPGGLVLVPGLGFAPNGARLGRGQGWYDRFLASWPGLVRIGVAFEDQVLDEIPETERDERVNLLATEKGLRSCLPRA